MAWINSYLLSINRHVRSFFYRIILLVYGILLAYMFPTLSVYHYITIFCLYVVYIRWYIVKGILSNATGRSFIDLIFIALCLYGKPLDNICVNAMLFIPIANAINHTGRGKQPYLYVVGLLAVYFVLLFLGDYERLDLRILYAIIAFTVFLSIQWFTAKNWMQNNRAALLKDAVEDFYIHGIRHDEVYKRIGQMFLAEHYPFKEMFCFISHDDYKSLYVVNGSRFVYNYMITVDKNEQKIIVDNAFCNNIKLVVDGETFDKNVVIAEPATSFKDNFDNTSYLFVICFDTDISRGLFVLDQIKRELRRFSQYLYSERIMRLRRKKNFEQIKDKGRFVDSAINTMHFIKNRLSSIQALTDVVNDMDAENVDADYIEVAKEAAARSNIDIESILQKAKYLLNKENNPFHYQPTETCKPRKMFSVLRQVWENILSNTSIKVENIERLSSEEYHIDTNMEGVEILFSDIIGNMFKYQKSNSSCICNCDDEYMTILFSNDFADKEATIALVDTYNANDKEEIIKRKTFGVSNIKSFVSDMGIQLFAVIETKEEKELFTLTLKFKLIRNEGFNN